jgi:hypothetical protein
MYFVFPVASPVRRAKRFASLACARLARPWRGVDVTLQRTRDSEVDDVKGYTARTAAPCLLLRYGTRTDMGDKKRYRKRKREGQKHARVVEDLVFGWYQGSCRKGEPQRRSGQGLPCDTKAPVAKCHGLIGLVAWTHRRDNISQICSTTVVHRSADATSPAVLSAVSRSLHRTQ